MFDSIRQIFRPRPVAPPPDRPLPAIPAGQRIYAVGDVHGRLDLFNALIQAVEADDAGRPPAQTTIILLGDLVDRGPDSAGVIAAARSLAERRSVRMIAGNHEEMFLNSFSDVDILREFLRFGGRETVLSYPIDPGTYRDLTLEETQGAMHRVIPAADLDFLRGFEDLIVIGDYVFVHAGIRPGVPLNEQEPRDLRWIRKQFVTSDEDFGHCIVHGHTIVEEPEIRTNRIGIDTGAYSSGRLTALALEGTQRWFIETQDYEGTISTSVRSCA
ncbi:MAG: metallophosphoesterase family protein [Novosphingobium sp.]